MTAPQTGQSTGACAPDITETEIETVCGQHGRDAVIVKVEGPRVTRHKVHCRAASTSTSGSRYMDTRYTAWFTAYLKAYDAAEAWAWRGEVPSTEAQAITVEGR